MHGLLHGFPQLKVGYFSGGGLVAVKLLDTVHEESLVTFDTSAPAMTFKFETPVKAALAMIRNTRSRRNSTQAQTALGATQ
eukprot:4521503-Amphidinium_carterae.1